MDDDDIGHNERLIRQALDRLGASDQVMIATKGGLTRGGPDQWTPNGRPDYLIAQRLIMGFLISIPKRSHILIVICCCHRYDFPLPAASLYIARTSPIFIT